MIAYITASHLVKRYGSRVAVDDISLTIDPGEVVAIIGPNGAGKTTTLEIILGLRRPDSGTVTYWRADALRQIGVQLQSTPFFRSLTAAENLRLFAAFYHVRLAPGQVQALLAQCNLRDAANIEAVRLSGGQQKRLAVALALAHQPQLLFLDEPTATLDPRARREVRALLASLAAAGTAIVFTSHDLEEVEKLATRIVLIINGQIHADGTAQQLRDQFHVASLEDLYMQLTAEEASI